MFSCRIVPMLPLEMSVNRLVTAQIAWECLMMITTFCMPYMPGREFPFLFFFPFTSGIVRISLMYTHKHKI